ncbi:hypothetical protein QBC35DRAFT_478452 [Podospora australis]|uniref:Nephrocystin 3-like N-terminal domain-containing protein n=1 Tax=Podospora australis TaxID=1536484 RepID=A0AAN7AC37_9PEZI|nr:hypothetical protein QBC35DRAFT_478452 [Podospora australis]
MQKSYHGFRCNRMLLSSGFMENPEQAFGDGTTVIYYFCRYSQADRSSEILKTIVLQLMKAHPDMVRVIYNSYVQTHREPSVRVLKMMLSGTPDHPGLLTAASPCRIILDGVDECPSQEQKFVIQDMLQLLSVEAAQNCKLLVCSGEMPEIARIMRKMKRLGMVLWARLVLDSLSDVDTLRELYDAIEAMPKELSNLYNKILTSMTEQKGERVAHRVLKILGWLVYAKRPLKSHEILHAVALTMESPVLDSWDVLDDSAIERCKPHIELLPDGSVGLIHFTAEEYLRERLRLDPTNDQVFHRTIALSCLLALCNGLDLLLPEIAEEHRLYSVASGSNAILLYAIDFWLDHLLGNEGADKHACFVKQYSQCSYACRFSPCTRALAGFPSETLSVTHERLHVRKLFCVHNDCPRGRIGFQNQRGLDAHTKEYHEKGGVLVPPRVRKVPSDILHITPRQPDRSQELASLIKEVPSDRDRPQVSKPNRVIYNADMPTAEKFSSTLTFKWNAVIASTDISPDTSLVAFGSNGQATIFDVNTSAVLYRWTGDFDVEEKIWNHRSDTIIMCSGHEKDIYDVCYYPDGQFVVSVGSDECTPFKPVVWNSLTPPAHDSLSGVAVSKNRRFLATASLDKNAYLFEPEPNWKDLKSSTQLGMPIPNMKSLNYHTASHDITLLPAHQT